MDAAINTTAFDPWILAAAASESASKRESEPFRAACIPPTNTNAHENAAPRARGRCMFAVTFSPSAPRAYVGADVTCGEELGRLVSWKVGNL